MVVYDKILGNIWQYERLAAGASRKIFEIHSATIKALSVEVTDSAARVRINIGEREFLNATFAELVARGYPIAVFPGGWRANFIQKGTAAAITVRNMEAYLTAPFANDVQYSYIVLYTPVSTRT